MKCTTRVAEIFVENDPMRPPAESAQVPLPAANALLLAFCVFGSFVYAISEIVTYVRSPNIVTTQVRSIDDLPFNERAFQPPLSDSSISATREVKISVMMGSLGAHEIPETAVVQSNSTGDCSFVSAVMQGSKAVPGTPMDLPFQFYKKGQAGTFIWARFNNVSRGSELFFWRGDGPMAAKAWKEPILPGQHVVLYVSLDLELAADSGDISNSFLRYDRRELINTFQRTDCTHVDPVSAACGHNFSPSEPYCNEDAIIEIRFKELNNVFVLEDQISSVIGNIGGAWSLLFMIALYISGAVQYWFLVWTGKNGNAKAEPEQVDSTVQVGV